MSTELLPGKHLFVDDFRIQEMHAARRVLHRPRSTPSTRCCVPSGPGRRCRCTPGAFVFDEERGCFRLWYTSESPPSSARGCWSATILPRNSGSTKSATPSRPAASIGNAPIWASPPDGLLEDAPDRPAGQRRLRPLEREPAVLESRLGDTPGLEFYYLQGAVRNQTWAGPLPRHARRLPGRPAPQVRPGAQRRRHRLPASLEPRLGPLGALARALHPPWRAGLLRPGWRLLRVPGHPRGPHLLRT